MNQKNVDLKFEEKSKLNSNFKFLNNQSKEDILKMKLMKKFNISPEEAEKVLFQIKNNEKMNNIIEKPIQNKSHNFDVNSDSSGSTKPLKNSNGVHISTQKESLDKNGSDIKLIRGKNQDSLFDSANLAEEDIGKLTENDVVPLINQKVNHNLSIESNDNFSKDIFQNENDVDSILQDIIPNYNQQISINVNHVDLTFEVQNEKVDTLKETFIRTLNGNKSTKFKIHALKDISFQIYKGEKVGIIGYNGAGKSTLLNVITGIYVPDKGNVTTYGKISPLLSLGAGFDQNFSGRKNIILNGAVLGYDKDYLYSKMDEIIEFSELGDFIDIPIKNYSSGMLAKLGFSIATSVNPDILIIDEILGVGDVNFQKKSADKMRALMDGGTTVLLVSHSIPQIRELCDKAIWLDNGSLRAIGEVNKICDEYLKDSEKASNEQLANIELIKK